MTTEQKPNRSFARKIKDTLFSTKSEQHNHVPKHRGRSKSWSKADRGRDKVRCKDRCVTLTTDGQNYAKWNGELREHSKEDGDDGSNSGLFSCKGSSSSSTGHSLPPTTEKNDFYYKAKVIYYPNSKKRVSVGAGDKKVQDNKNSQGNKSPSGFSIRKLLHLKPKHGKEDSSGSDDSNNNYCLMEKLQGIKWEEINESDSAAKPATRYHDYCTDLDSKYEEDNLNENTQNADFHFKRSEAIYGTGKRRSRRNFSSSGYGRNPEPPPLPQRPSSIPQEPKQVKPKDEDEQKCVPQPVGVGRHPSIPHDISHTPYTGTVPTARLRSPLKEKDVVLVKTLKLDFLQKSVISGVAVTRKQEYVVVDLKEAYVVDEEGHLKRTIGTKGSQRLHEPIDVTTMDSNLVFSDHAHQEVKIYSLRGQFLKKVADKSLCNIAGVAVNDKKEIFICGTDKQRVSVHSEEDELLFTIPAAAQTKDKGSGTYAGSSNAAKSLFDHPYSIAINPLTGDIIVGDDYEQKVTAVSREGRVLWRFVPASKFTERAFFPCSIAVDPLGYVFVADLLNANVYMLDSSGRFLKTLLSRAEGITTGPAAIATDGKGQLIVADDDRTLKVFKYGDGEFAIPRRISVVPQ